MNEFVTVRNTLNGEVAVVRPQVLDNPHLAKHLVIVEDDAKPMVLMKPATAEEFQSRRATYEDPLENEFEDEEENEEG